VDADTVFRIASGTKLYMDQFRYAALPLDEFDFMIGPNSHVQGVRALGLGEVFMKAGKGKQGG